MDSNKNNSITIYYSMFAEDSPETTQRLKYTLDKILKRKDLTNTHLFIRSDQKEYLEDILHNYKKEDIEKIRDRIYVYKNASTNSVEEHVNLLKATYNFVNALNTYRPINNRINMINMEIYTSDYHVPKQKILYKINKEIRNEIKEIKKEYDIKVEFNKVPTNYNLIKKLILTVEHAIAGLFGYSEYLYVSVKEGIKGLYKSSWGLFGSKKLVDSTTAASY
ncbi:MAG: hypothetical protein ACP5GJ_01185 [Nanopusillaceae archaeon]|jgi:hypothetical protein